MPKIYTPEIALPAESNPDTLPMMNKNYRDNKATVCIMDAGLDEILLYVVSISIDGKLIRHSGCSSNHTKAAGFISGAFPEERDPETGYSCFIRVIEA